MDISGFLLGSVPCGYFHAGEHEWQFIKLGSSSTRPWVLTKIVGKGDVRSFKVLPFFMCRHRLHYPLASEQHFLVSGNDCLVSVFVLTA